MMRVLAWGAMVFLALTVAAYAAAVLINPSIGAPLVLAHRARMPLALFAHLAGGGAALALGAWQFNASIRGRAPRVHRWIGRGYVASVLAGGIGALALAPRAEHGVVSQAGFLLLALFWLGTTLAAYRSIRARDITRHQQWMVRSYALTLAAVTLRLYLPLSQIAGIPFPHAYQLIAWISWVPNLLAAEWWFVRRARPVPVPAIRP